MVPGPIATPAHRGPSVPDPRLPWPALRLLRPSQWLKNAFVLAPWVFTASFRSRERTVDVAIAFGAFCLAASTSYVFNDLLDIAADRNHPLKHWTRPLAAGALRVSTAWRILAALVLATAAAVVLRPRLAPVIGLYLLVNLAYTLWLKHVPVVDLFALASGFLLRVYAGSVVLDVPVSFWMFVTTLCVALHLAAIKRRQELVLGGEARPVLGGYSTPLLDAYAQLAAAAAFVFYGQFVYTIRPALLPTVPLVLFGFFRYRYLVDVYGGGESPTDTLLADPLLLGTALLWLGWCVRIMWQT